MKKASLIAVLAWLAACAGLWWMITILAKTSSHTYAAVVYGDNIKSHLAFEDRVRLDVFWAAWRYASIIPSLVASVAAIMWRDRSDAFSKVVVAFLVCGTTVMLLMGAWSAWVVKMFFLSTFQLLR